MVSKLINTVPKRTSILNNGFAANILGRYGKVTSDFYENISLTYRKNTSEYRTETITKHPVYITLHLLSQKMYMENHPIFLTHQTLFHNALEMHLNQVMETVQREYHQVYPEILRLKQTIERLNTNQERQEMQTFLEIQMKKLLGNHETFYPEESELLQRIDYSSKILQFAKIFQNISQSDFTFFLQQNPEKMLEILEQYEKESQISQQELGKEKIELVRFIEQQKQNIQRDFIPEKLHTEVQLVTEKKQEYIEVQNLLEKIQRIIIDETETKEHIKVQKLLEKIQEIIIDEIEIKEHMETPEMPAIWKKYQEMVAEQRILGGNVDLEEKHFLFTNIFQKAENKERQEFKSFLEQQETWYSKTVGVQGESLVFLMQKNPEKMLEVLEQYEKESQIRRQKLEEKINLATFIESQKQNVSQNFMTEQFSTKLEQVIEKIKENKNIEEQNLFEKIQRFIIDKTETKEHIKVQKLLEEIQQILIDEIETKEHIETPKMPAIWKKYQQMVAEQRILGENVDLEEKNFLFTNIFQEAENKERQEFKSFLEQQETWYSKTVGVQGESLVFLMQKNPKKMLEVLEQYEKESQIPQKLEEKINLATFIESKKQNVSQNFMTEQFSAKLEQVIEKMKEDKNIEVQNLFEQIQQILINETEIKEHIETPKMPAIWEKYQQMVAEQRILSENIDLEEKNFLFTNIFQEAENTERQEFKSFLEQQETWYSKIAEVQGESLVFLMQQNPEKMLEVLEEYENQNQIRQKKLEEKLKLATFIEQQKQNFVVEQFSTKLEQVIEKIKENKNIKVQNLFEEIQQNVGETKEKLEVENLLQQIQQIVINTTETKENLEIQNLLEQIQKIVISSTEIKQNLEVQNLLEQIQGIVINTTQTKENLETQKILEQLQQVVTEIKRKIKISQNKFQENIDSEVWQNLTSHQLLPEMPTIWKKYQQELIEKKLLTGNTKLNMAEKYLLFSKVFQESENTQRQEFQSFLQQQETWYSKNMGIQGETLVFLMQKNPEKMLEVLEQYERKHPIPQRESELSSFWKQYQTMIRLEKVIQREIVNQEKEFLRNNYLKERFLITKEMVPMLFSQQEILEKPYSFVFQRRNLLNVIRYGSSSEVQQLLVNMQNNGIRLKSRHLWEKTIGVRSMLYKKILELTEEQIEEVAEQHFIYHISSGESFETGKWKDYGESVVHRLSQGSYMVYRNHETQKMETQNVEEIVEKQFVVQKEEISHFQRRQEQAEELLAKQSQEIQKISTMVKEQSQIMEQLKRNQSATPNHGVLYKEMMKRMEQQLHLERQRRGLD